MPLFILDHAYTQPTMRQEVAVLMAKPQAKPQDTGLKTGLSLQLPVPSPAAAQPLALFPHLGLVHNSTSFTGFIRPKPKKLLVQPRHSK